MPHIRLSKQLALHVYGRLHIPAISSKRLMMMSRTKMPNDDLVVTTSQNNEQFVADGPAVRALGEAFHFNIHNYERLVLWDIAVSPSKPPPAVRKWG